jgi:excinuclease ABC subunit C
MRAGKLVGRLGFTADAADQEPGNVLQRVIEEHYSQLEPVEVPPEILVQYRLPQHDLLVEWLCEQRGRRVKVVFPQRQNKVELIDLVERNASFELARAKHGQEQQMLATEDLAQLLELNMHPRRI